MIRYACVGTLAYGVDFLTLVGLTEIVHVYYLTSAAVGFTMGLVTNYLLSISWVFRKRNLDSRSLEFGLFAVIGVVGLGLNHVFIWTFTEHVGFHYVASKVVSTAAVFFWNFFARKFLLFS
jgi:putative flippase GtrA